MGVLDFLSDLSKARSKDELGLGGMRSLLGTRGAAPQGKRGDEMMSRTSSDSLPGYFDPETREYVPWYVDLFDGGGLNKSEGLLSDAQKVTTAVDMLDTKRAPVQRAGQMAPGLGSQLSDMERMQRANPLEPFGGSGPAIQDTPDTSYYTPPSSMQMPTPAGPGMPSYTPPSSMQMPTQNNAEYEQFVKFLSDDGGFTRELQNPEWMQRAFSRYMRSLANQGS